MYRDGSSVLLARTGTVTCLYTILSRYFHLAVLNCYSSDFVFRNLVYHKSTLSYSLGSRPISYSRARELLLNSLVELGFPKSSCGLQSLRSGGASAAANAGISDRLFKRHPGHWKSDRAKEGYVKDNINYLLSVSRSLGLQFSLNCALSSKWANLCLINKRDAPSYDWYFFLLALS